MLAGTHVSLPLIIAGLWDNHRIKNARVPLFSRTNLVFIALAGILPDLLSLHVSLAARHASQVHTVWFLGYLLPLFLLPVIPRFRSLFPTFLLCWTGVALHLFCDMISGGIPFWGVGNGIVGHYFVPPALWGLLDATNLLIAWLVFFRQRYLLHGPDPRSKECSWETSLVSSWEKAGKPAPQAENIGATPQEISEEPQEKK